MVIVVSNKSIVLRLIQKATENPGVDVKGVIGKKALQKSIYFFNLKHSYFNFRWADYGPLSGEVQQIVEDLTSGNKIIVKDIETKKKDAFIKNMLYVEGSSDFEGFPAELDSTLDKIVKFTAGKGPRDLELLASVHFWAQKQQDLTDEYTVEYIHEKLTELKPDAGFTSSDVERAMQNLENNDFLVPITEE
jgi:uncharacterized protein YwgA